MTNSNDLDTVSHSWDEHSEHSGLPSQAQIQVAEAAPAQKAGPTAAEPVPVDVGSGVPVKPEAPAEAKAPAAAAPHEYVADANHVVKLPANVSIDNIKVDGHNLVLEQADGSVIVIKDGALNVPTFIIGDVEVPRVALIAALEASHVDVAFGADGSISAGPGGSTSSAGGDFSVPPGGIGDGFGLSALLPPTDLAFGQPDHRELFPSIIKPNSIPSIIDLTPSVDGGDTTVNEKGIPASSGAEGSGEAAAPGVDGDTSEHNTGTFTITSPDGVGSLTIAGQVISGAALANSASTPIDITTPLGNTLTISGYDASTGQVTYTYTLVHGAAHPGAGTDSIFDDMTVTVTDSDGDTSVPGTLSVQIIDDVPTATADIGNVPSGSHAAITGDVSVNDVFGADGKDAAGGVVGVAAGTTAGGIDANVGTQIHGLYGTLTLQADGSYSYLRDAGSQGGHNDVFTYTIKDGDGDLSHTTLTISIGDATPTIGDLTPQGSGGDTTVNEKGLPASSGSEGSGELAAPGADGDPSEHNTGTFTITSPDGIATLTINGTAISAAALTNSASVPVNVTTPDGNTLTITGFNAGTGQVSYTYTLVDNETHPGAGTDSIFDNMTVTVTDTDGDVSAPGTLSVQIIDDVPTANLDTNSVASGSFAAVTGQVLTNDVFGADGAALTAPAGGVVGVAAGTTAGGIDANVGTQIHGLYGTLTLQADGSYSYLRDAGSQGGHNDVFTYTIKDGDGDLSHTTLTISIGDATPTIGDLTPQGSGGDTTVNEKGLPASSGSEGSGELAAPGADGDPSEHNTGTFTITSPDGIATLTINGTAISAAALTNSASVPVNVTTPDGNTLTITGFNAGTGQVSYTYTLVDNETHPGAGTDSIFDNMTVTVTDTDGDVSAPGTLSVQIIDDVPTANLDTNSVASGSFAAVTGQVLTNDVFGADGAALTAPAGGVVGVAAGTTAGGIDANVGTQIHGLYGTLTLQADGSYSYLRDAGSQGGHNDVFTYTIKDGDGDLSHTTLTISIGDATPTIGDLTPQGSGGDTTVNEKGLPASSGSEGSGELAAPGADGDPSEHNTGTFTITSPDGIATLTINGTAISAAALTNSASVPVNVTTPDGNTLTITGFNAGTGQVSYTYTLVDNETHPGAGTDSIFDNMTVTVTDTDGDVSAPGTLSVQIIDDVPTANLDTNSVASGSFAAVTGQVLTNDVFGADGAALTAPAGGVVGVAAGTTAGGIDANVGTQIHGLYGTLTLQADGSYSYLRDAGSQGGHNDVFTYTIKDGDGDLSHTTLTISIGDATPTIGDLTPQGSGGDTTVNEKGLPASSGSEGSGELAAPGADGDPSEHNTGTFTITSPDGIATLTINGTAISAAALTNSASVPVNVTTPDGNTLTITGFNAGTGQVSYTYTLVDNETHPGAGTDSIFDNMTVTVTDTDGDVSAPGTLSVQIIDDVPTANLDTNSVASGSFAAVTGQVLTNDVFGADGAALTAPAGGVVGVAAGTTAGGIDANVGTQIHGLYGTLTLQADGSYSYLRDAGSQGGHNDVFTYTIKDGDGDLSHTTLTISIGDATPTIGDLTPQGSGGDTTVNEKGLPASSGSEGSGELAAPGADGDPSEHNTGTFTITSPDGIATLTINGTAISAAALTNSASVPVNVTTPDGNTLTITGFNAGTGQVSYTYTLVDNETHPGAGTDSIFDNMTVTVTDTDGDVSAPGTLSVQIIDDVPTANLDTNSVASGSFAAVTGQVLTNDVFGADGAALTAPAGGVVGVAAGTTAGGIDANVGTQIHGLYGTLTLQADGSYSYLRDAGSQGGHNDVFTYTIKDGDGDLSHTTLTISIGDATPTIGDLTPQGSGGDTTVNEKGLPASSGSEGSGELAAPGADGDPSEHNTGTFTITSPDGIATLTINGTAISAAALTNSASVPVNVTTPDGNTLTITGFNAGTGQVSYTYTLVDNETHPGAGTDSIFDNMTVTVTDTDGDVSAPGTLSVQIIDDVPTANLDTNSVASGSFAAVTGQVLTNDVFGADGAALTAPAGGVVGVAAGTTAGGIDANVGTQIHGLYGTLTLQADGSYSYLRDAGSQGGHNDVFTYTIKDGDGDLSHTTLTISIGDATPTIGDLTPQGSGGDTTVNEKGLPASSGSEGSGELAAPGADGDPSEHNTGTFTITSPDGIATLTINGTAISAAALTNSASVPVNVTTPDGNTLTITGFNAGTGQVSYTYTLVDNETHPGAGTDSIFDNMTVTVTDTDGDVSAPGTLSVQIIDDVPTANLDTNSVASGSFAAVTGQVLTNDVFGADGAALTAPAGGVVGVAAGTTAGGIDANVGTQIHGLYGTLTLQADGSYSYLRDAGSQGGHNDVFTYTIKDGDGDLSHTTLTISIGDATPTIGDLTPQGSGGDTTVNEKGLPASSGSEGSGELAAPGADGDPSEHNTGTFTITSPDGIATLTINGTAISAAALTNSASVPVNVTTPDGNTLTITGFNAGTGQVSYTYTLVDNETHPGAGTDSIFDNMTVTVTDTDGDVSAPGTLSVQIIDDVPTLANRAKPAGKHGYVANAGGWNTPLCRRR